MKSDIYDQMDPDVGPKQRRYNRERLAQLEAETAERHARMMQVPAFHFIQRQRMEEV